MSISQKYQKFTHVEHVLKKPDTYIGSVENEETEMYIHEEQENGPGVFIKKTVNYIPGLYKCFDEILVNALDQYTRLKEECKTKTGKKKPKPVSIIRISVNKEDNSIEVWNDGEGIDIIMMPEHKMYPPELIFGNLLTSTNYDDNEEKIVGGKNGYGAKLVNIFSTEFVIETVDRVRKLKFLQTYSANMSSKTTPIITEYTGKPFTRIKFKPDLERFNISELGDEFISIIRKRVYDAATWVDAKTKVYWNKYEIPIKTFEDYVKLYIGDQPRVYEKLDDYWEMAVTYSNDDDFDQVSFVNGINTLRGGKHVDYIVDQIKTKLTAIIKKKRKIMIKPTYV